MLVTQGHWEGVLPGRKRAERAFPKKIATWRDRRKNCSTRALSVLTRFSQVTRSCHNSLNSAGPASATLHDIYCRVHERPTPDARRPSAPSVHPPEPRPAARHATRRPPRPVREHWPWSRRCGALLVALAPPRPSKSACRVHTPLTAVSVRAWRRQRRAVAWAGARAGWRPSARTLLRA